MDRRGFLKLMGGLAALPVVGKFFKFTKATTKGLEKVPQYLKDQGMPDFFYDLVAGVKKFGKKTKSGRDYDTYEYTHPKTKQKVEVIDGRDEVGIGFETDKGFRGEMGVKKGIPDELTKGKTPPDEYYEGEMVYKGIGRDGYTKEFEEGIEGGYKGLEELTKRIGKAGGGPVGMPPVFETNDPKEAVKEMIRRTPTLGGGTMGLPIYSGDKTQIDFLMGSPNDPFQYGISALTPYGEVSTVRGQDNVIRGEYGFSLPQQTGKNINYYVGYDEDRGPRLDVRYEKKFADGGGVKSGPPPKRGPNPQGLESLFQTR